MQSAASPGRLIVISGPSGVGKSSLVKALMANKANFNASLALSISYTTRSQRPSEVDGKNYHFVDKSTFQSMIDTDQMLEWAQLYHHFYGTGKQATIDHLQAGNDVILEIDVQGGALIKKQSVNNLSIFISPPNYDELANRLETRGRDEASELLLRRKQWSFEMEQQKFYDHTVVNDNFDTALKEIQKLILK